MLLPGLLTPASTAGVAVLLVTSHRPVSAPLPHASPVLLPVSPASEAALQPQLSLFAWCPSVSACSSSLLSPEAPGTRSALTTVPDRALVEGVLELTGSTLDQCCWRALCP